MRRSLIIANRKMHGSLPENQAFLEGVAKGIADCPDIDCVVCLPHPYLFQAQAFLTGTTVAWGGQNMSRYHCGPYTGSVSPGMLREFGCEYVIIAPSGGRAATKPIARSVNGSRRLSMQV